MLPNNSKTLKAAWVRYRAAAYLGGRGLSFGCGAEPVVPPAAQDLGKYSVGLDWCRGPVAVCDSNYDLFARGEADHVFVGPRLEFVTDPELLLPQLASKLRQGGHFVIHTTGTPTLAKLREILEGCGGWQEKDTYERDGQVLGIWKLVAPRQREIRPPTPVGPRRACIARYGAIGDLIILTPLIKRLAEDGYEVTLNVTPYSADVLRGNPYVSNIILQERDLIPNQELGDYWKEWEGDYQKYINLSESIEGSLLKVEGRRDFYSPACWRRSTCTANYYEEMLRLAGYPQTESPVGQLYFSSSERHSAEFVRGKFRDKFLVLWGLKGSSHHKQFPMLRPFLERWLPSHPFAHVMFCGSPADSGLGWDSLQTSNIAGQIPLREVFALAPQADLVVGPESSLINAAGCFPTSKLVLLSHSTCTNLCKHFANHICVAPSSPCYPCHQLHYNQESCPLVTIADVSSGEAAWKGPRCSAEYPLDKIEDVLSQAYQNWQTRSSS